VFSLQGLDCADCATHISKEVKKIKGVKRTSFDVNKVELTVRMADAVSDDAVVAAITRAGYTGTAGSGKGAYLPFPDYPAGADVVTLTESGQAVGPLEKLRVPGKYTVFDVFADWCSPCRVEDKRLREIVTGRTDIAVRKLNVVSFTSPLARELGSRLSALPHVVVFTPDGKRTDISGLHVDKLTAALAAKAQ
jgi:copper chaperone CopZ